MKSLARLYEEISRNKVRWSYYWNNPSEMSGVWENNDKAYNFIQGYFEFGGKKKLLEDANLIVHPETVKERAPHIVSSFILGIILAEGFGICTWMPDDDSVNFLYLWFLSCLYHDIGYAYENNSTTDWLKLIQFEGIDAVR